MKNYFEKTMDEGEGRKSLSPLSVVNTRFMNSTFTPIRREDCAPDKKFGQPRYMKSKIEEVED
jgi:hypothetical protein